MITNTFTTPSGKYLVESYGNGWAYTVTHQPSGSSVFVQDHDAEQMQADTNNFECEIALDSWFDAVIP